MSTPAATTTAAPAGSADAAGFLRRNRTAVALGTAAVLALLLVTWLGRGNGDRGGYLDPESASPGGSRALAQVLGDHGVPVEVVRGRRAFEGAAVDARTTVVVTNPDALGKRTLADVDDRTRAAAGSVLVVAGLTPVVADRIGVAPQDLATATDEERTPADCSPTQPLLEGLTLTTPGLGLGVAGQGCFGTAAGRLLLVDRDGHRWVLVDGTPLTNDEVDRDDNAAVALRLLGQRDRVLWYVADPADISAAEATDVSRLLPRWLKPAVWLIAVAALALLLQRGRRLGPLVTEPMPVTIRALESTTALGRLYEKARDRRHAAALLVDGTLARMRVQLGTANADRDELVRAVAQRTGRPVRQVADLLVSDDIRSDADLVARAQELTQLEDEVRSL